jgi:hypothetical protein
LSENPHHIGGAMRRIGCVDSRVNGFGARRAP